MTPFFNPQAVPWWSFVEWSETTPGVHVAKGMADSQAKHKGEFVLSVWHEDGPYDSAASEAWHWRVDFHAITVSHGFSFDTEHGERSCRRTAVKFAAFHGMALPIEIMRQVAGLLIDPHGVQDPMFPNDPTKRVPARRVAFDGHSAKAMRRVTPAADED